MEEKKMARKTGEMIILLRRSFYFSMIRMNKVSYKGSILNYI